MGTGLKGKARGRRERTEGEKAADLADASKLYLDGLTQRDIVDWFKGNRKYTLSLTVVHKLIRQAIEIWKAQAVASIDEIKARDLAKLADMEREATAAFERSKTHAVKIVQEKFEGRNLARKVMGKRRAAEVFKTVVTKEQRDGDPRWYQIILECIRERKDILGYAKPKQLEIGGTDGGPIEINSTVRVSLEKAYGKAPIEVSMPTPPKLLKNSQDWRSKPVEK